MNVSFDFVAWVVIPVLIFVAKLADVSLATVRHILVYKGMRRIVPLLAFVEVSIWLLAITQVMQNLDNWMSILAWSAGFAAGTSMGMWLEEKLALGYQLIRVISRGNHVALIDAIRSKGFGATLVEASGAKGAVQIVLVVSERKRLFELRSILAGIEPEPFYTVEDVRSVESRPWMRNLKPGTFAVEGDLKRK